MQSLRDFFSSSSERPFTVFLVRLAGICIGVCGLAALALPGAGASDVTPARDSLKAVRAKYASRLTPIENKGELAIFEGRPGNPAVNCADLLGPRTMVALVFGQSNASNTVDPGYHATNAVYAYFDGQCRKAYEALPGATGAKGSTWPRLGDRIVASGLYDTVIFMDIARGGSSVLQWAPGGQLAPLLTGALDDLAARGMTPTHILFHQGEADCALRMTRQEYGTALDAVLGEIRAHGGGQSDVFVSRASLYLDPTCGDRHDPGCYRSCPAITAAQTAAADPEQRVFSGPNTDLLVPWFDRNDGYHFTARAADRFAMAWMPLLARGETTARVSQQ